jgi:predicted naringenin-chalcone synthase
MSLEILGLGTAVPAHTMSQQEATELAQQVCCENDEQARLLRVLYRKAGVENRHTCLPHRIALDWVGNGDNHAPAVNGAVVAVSTLGPTTSERMAFYEEHALPLARQAARTAVDLSSLRPQEITHLVTVTCTGFVAPGVDVDLITQLELPSTTQRIQVGFMGCHGAINGLRVAAALAAADPAARILLCAVELCSLHYRFQWDPERFIGNVLFADGAAALVCAASLEKSAATSVGSPNSSSIVERPWRVLATGSCLLPDSKDAMTWRVGDHGFEMTLSPRVPDLIGLHLRPWLESWLAGLGISLEDIGSWAVHPGGPRILSAVEESLGLPREATAVSRRMLAEYGNMSSPTVLFILDRLRQQQAARPCVALGFGPGLVAEAALLV